MKKQIFFKTLSSWKNIQQYTDMVFKQHLLWRWNMTIWDELPITSKQLTDISFDGSIKLIQEYNQTLKSNIWVMQTGTMKEHIFYQFGDIMLYSYFQQSNFILFFTISTFNTLMVVAEFTKISNLTSNSLVRHLLLPLYSLFHGILRIERV